MFHLTTQFCFVQINMEEPYDTKQSLQWNPTRSSEVPIQTYTLH